MTYESRKDYNNSTNIICIFFLSKRGIYVPCIRLFALDKALERIETLNSMNVKT